MAQRETPRLPIPAATAEYLTDARQRSILFLDVMRRRAAQYEAHAAAPPPTPALLDPTRPPGELPARPYRPAQRVDIDPKKRPFVIVDPRAGHGPGIGGFKADSEIGVAMKAGHQPTSSASCPTRCPARPSSTSRRRGGLSRNGHRPPPRAEGKPCVIGNCQAGWAVMLLAAQRPELFGPIIVAGTPLSYWAASAASTRCATPAACSAAPG